MGYTYAITPQAMFEDRFEQSHTRLSDSVAAFGYFLRKLPVQPSNTPSEKLLPGGIEFEPLLAMSQECRGMLTLFHLGDDCFGPVVAVQQLRQPAICFFRVVHTHLLPVSG